MPTSLRQHSAQDIERYTGTVVLGKTQQRLEPEKGQPLRLLWQKKWNRQHRAKPPTDETPEEQKERQARTRKEKPTRPFIEQAKTILRWYSYRWRIEE